jgi:hypothetical protein
MKLNIRVIDLNNKTIKLPENSNFYITDENNLNYSTECVLHKILVQLKII